jgi:hypothetical protein
VIGQWSIKISIYEIKCQYDTDGQCYKTLNIEILIDNLTSEQVSDIVENGGCEFTKQEAKNCMLTLSISDKSSLKDNCSIYRETCIKDDIICPACGSDN